MTRTVYLTVEEAAGIARLHPATVRRMLARGDLPGLKLGSAWRVSAAAWRTAARGGHHRARLSGPGVRDVLATHNEGGAMTDEGARDGAEVAEALRRAAAEQVPA